MSKRAPTREAVANAIAMGAHTIPEIVAKTGMETGRVKNATYALLGRGDIIRTGRGTYGDASWQASHNGSVPTPPRVAPEMALHVTPASAAVTQRVNRDDVIAAALAGLHPKAKIDWHHVVQIVRLMSEVTT